MRGFMRWVECVSRENRVLRIEVQITFEDILAHANCLSFVIRLSLAIAVSIAIKASVAT